MSLGEKIKSARLEAGLSQRQLCGDTITRNMLSQIENGSARPSMDTLSWFARQLGRPVSWFLEEEAVSSPNQPAIARARQAYSAGEFRQALESLEDCRQPDELFDSERWLLEAMSLMGFAKEVLAQGKAVYAVTLLEQAWQAGEKTPYFTAPLKREWTLLMYEAQPAKASELAQTLPPDDRELCLLAEAAIARQEYAAAARVLDAARERDPHWHYLRGQTALAQKDYSHAAEHYRMAEAQYPALCAQALEQCYRELEDYKMAYLYAKK